MSNELSDADAQKLFNEIANANGDPLKLDALLASSDVVTDEGKPEEVVEETQVPEEVVEETPTDETPVPEAAKEEDTPAIESKPEDTPAAEVKTEEDPTLVELRAQLEKLSKENHALKSQAGRVPHVQRRLKELDQKLEELAQKAASPSNHPSATIQPKVLEKLKGIRETDPELADALAAAFAEANTGLADDAINREKQTLTLLREQEVKAYQAAQVELLLEMVPNAAEVVASPSWVEWKKQQSEDILRLANSDHAESVAIAFERYARDMRAKHPELVKEAPQSAPAQAAKPSDADAAKAAQIEEERRRKQAAAVSVSSPAAAGKVSLPDDPEALFKKYFEDIQKQRTG